MRLSSCSTDVTRRSNITRRYIVFATVFSSFIVPVCQQAENSTNGSGTATRTARGMNDLEALAARFGCLLPISNTANRETEEPGSLPLCNAEVTAAANNTANLPAPFEGGNNRFKGEDIAQIVKVCVTSAGGSRRETVIDTRNMTPKERAEFWGLAGDMSFGAESGSAGGSSGCPASGIRGG